MSTAKIAKTITFILSCEIHITGISYNHLTKVDSIKIVNHMLSYEDNPLSIILKECNNTIIKILKRTVLDDKYIVFIKNDPNTPIIAYYYSIFTPFKMKLY